VNAFIVDLIFDTSFQDRFANIAVAQWCAMFPRLIAIGEFDAFANGGMVGRAAIRRFSRRWGFSELSDPASFPLIMFLLTFSGTC